MSDSVHGMIAALIEREGGYSNHRTDKGGPTKYGITQRTLSIYLKRPVSIDEVRYLTEEKAAEIYERLYYLDPHIDLLPQDFQAQVLDMCVNHGAPDGIRYFQQFLNTFGSGLKVDGIIGPKTVKAGTVVIKQLGKIEANNQLAEFRKSVYLEIVKNDPTQIGFRNGWLKRAKEFIAQKEEVFT